MLEIGTLLDGKYRILGDLPSGGNVKLYRAVYDAAGLEVVIKEIGLDRSHTEDKQIMRNAYEMWHRLDHPNIPGIFDVMEKGDLLYATLEAIEGVPIERAVAEKGDRKQEYVVGLSMQVCDALGYLHSQIPPVLYLDMKPGNLLVTNDGKVKLVDFGLAKLCDGDDGKLKACMGTIGYSPPEQYGERVDARADIYALGATMYCLLTGKNPGEPPYEMYPIRQFDPGFSPGLEDIILKCTQNARRIDSKPALDFIRRWNNGRNTPTVRYPHLTDIWTVLKGGDPYPHTGMGARKCLK